MIKSNNLIFTSFNLSAVICSFIFSYITIKFFLKYIKNDQLVGIEMDEKVVEALRKI